MLISNTQINTVLDRIADQLNSRVWHQPPLVICVLGGGIFAFADLVRKLTFDHKLSYHHLYPLPSSGQSVIVIDDIFETGKTCQRIIKSFSIMPKDSAMPKDITYIHLLKRKHQNPLIFSQVPLTLMFGIEIESKKWLAGYGMDDYNGLNRNKNYIYELS